MLATTKVVKVLVYFLAVTHLFFRLVSFMYSESIGECDNHCDWCISCCGVRDLKTLHFCTMDCVSLSDLGQFIILFKSLWMVLM